mmetsp:Transcript_58276/g.173434  ORF Transcript_58276/g.173434 Transcript_58276/m.173434 type:complete len:149 (-) Transcript_58276:106-552(-)|eukprot:CAMPEP_0175231220 /NCGR_PEP_ID=MMETSP0093-20121207/25346_1 /TAXON_ID=311494 /ORGANISM="Alexandrium monilatum, Strain CCMP3105" /LENGTH=148 /DNA_ID=CAMNT_0016525069 /DNA_START=100 /DNA_END=546 /DNA_ORIENTATION=-
MGQTCCQEGVQATITVAIDELGEVFHGEGHSGQSVCTTSERAQGTQDEKSQAATLVDRTDRTAAGSEVGVAKDSGQAKQQKSSKDKASRVRVLEQRVAGLKAELAVANRKLQVARGDPKTPIWIEVDKLSRSDSCHSSRSDSSLSFEI